MWTQRLSLRGGADASFSGSQLKNYTISGQLLQRGKARRLVGNRPTRGDSSRVGVRSGLRFLLLLLLDFLAFVLGHLGALRRIHFRFFDVRLRFGRCGVGRNVEATVWTSHIIV